MGLRLVNLLPESTLDYTKPGQPLQMGLKSDGDVAVPTYGSVLLGTLRVSLGYTSVQNEGLLPENSITLPELGGTVELDTAERIRPVGAQVTRSSFGTGIKLDAPGTASPVGIYSVQMPIARDAAVLGYFKFKSKLAWSLATRNWCNLSNMTGMYFGLEYGPANTICWASLRGSGTGSLVIGGPMSSFGSARPAQQEFTAFNWVAQPDNTTLEMWIVFSQVGYPAPFAPTNTPILEVWTKRGGVDVVPVCHTGVPGNMASPVPITLLGQFPSTLAAFPNFRSGPTDTATLYFGNVGDGSDSLELLDWALFPDYRVAVVEGSSVGKNTLTVLVDSPLLYDCTNGKPQDVAPGRWFSMPDAGYLPPSSDLHFSPLRAKPSFLVHSKVLPGGSGFQRQEPRLEKKEDGAVVEAYVSAEIIEKVADSVGTGMSLDDGTNLFQVVMLESDTRRTIGLSKIGPVGDLVDGYFTPSATLDSHLDWRSLKLLKLVVDRLRGRVSLFVNDVRYIDVALTDPLLPLTTSPVGGRVAFGHVEVSDTTAKLNTAFLSYLTRYVAWELDEQKLPDDGTAPVVFTLDSYGAASQVLYPAAPNATELQIGKVAFGTASSHCCYSKALPTFDDWHGIQVDFKAKVMGYTDGLGTSFAKNVWVGAGIQVFLSGKRLHLGFFDCGMDGRFIGIIPGSGSTTDIVERTDLGKRFSAPVDWTSSTFFRLVYRPYIGISVWVDNIQSGPVLTIPWRNDTDGFDLPVDSTSAAVAFGHFDLEASSTTSWEFFRYGFSNGYEVAVEPQFEFSERAVVGYLYGGRTLIQTEFEE